MFWDGDPAKQRFINIVGLSTPTARPRPASAPARGSHTSAFGSPRQQDRPLSFTAEDLVEHDAYNVRHHDGKGRNSSAEHEARERVGMGRVGVLELRLRQLVLENARMRDALLKKVRGTRLEQLAKAQRRKLELIGGLQATKESADSKRTRTLDRVRDLQVYAHL